MEHERTIVIGGGLAGLTAAATLARGGHPVTLVEGAEHVGGRGSSRHRHGFDLNTGPHALYRAAGGRAVLRGLGVPVRGAMPRFDRTAAWFGGEALPLGRHLRRNVGDRARVLKALTGLGPGAAAAWAGRPASEWIQSVTDDEQGRLALTSLVRTTTYSADTTILDAGAVTTQLRVAMHGVLYLHHGWSSLVGGLLDVIGASGGVIMTGTPVAEVEHDERVHGVRLADDRTLPAGSVVVAVNDPHRAAGLLTGDAAGRVGARRPRPSRCASPTSTSPCGRSPRTASPPCSAWTTRSS